VGGGAEERNAKEGERERGAGRRAPACEAEDEGLEGILEEAERLALAKDAVALLGVHFVRGRHEVVQQHRHAHLRGPQGRVRIELGAEKGTERD
jgi:hypothetical protein